MSCSAEDPTWSRWPRAKEKPGTRAGGAPAAAQGEGNTYRDDGPQELRRALEKLLR